MKNHETIWQPQWDALTLQPGMSMLHLFQNPVGVTRPGLSRAATFETTSMELPGQLPRGHRFMCVGLLLTVRGLVPSDEELLLDRGVFELHIGNKRMLFESPLRRLTLPSIALNSPYPPAMPKLRLVERIKAAIRKWLGLTRYAPTMYEIVPLLIAESEYFRVSIYFATPPEITEPVRLMVHLNGHLIRERYDA